MDIPPDLIITMDDVRRYHCVRGAKAWFEGYGLDFRAFKANGILATDLAATGDGLALRVIRLTMERSHG